MNLSKLNQKADGFENKQTQINKWYVQGDNGSDKLLNSYYWFKLKTLWFDWFFKVKKMNPKTLHFSKKKKLNLELISFLQIFKSSEHS